MTNYELMWTPTTDAHDGQYVYRSTTSSPSFPSDYTLLTVVSANDGFFTDRAAPSGTTQYAVTAWNYDGVNNTIDESSPLTIAMGAEPPPPTAPTNLSATLQ